MRRCSGSYRPALVAAGVGLLFSLVGAAAVGRWEDRVNKIEFENAAETEAIVMQNGMNEYISRLVALRTLFESSNEEITRSEFETFSARLFERHPGMLRIAWLPRVNRKERAEYEAAAIADGVSGYRIKSLQGDGFDVAPQSDEYFPVFYSTQPKTSLGLRHGLRDRSGPPCGARAGTGQRPGRVACAGAALRVPRRTAGCRDVLVVMVPVYAKGTSRETVADRRRNLRGLRRRHLRPAAADAVHSRDDRSKPRRQRERLSALHGTNRQPGAGAAGLSRRPPRRRNRCATSRAPALVWAHLKIGDTDWQVRAVPTAGGRWRRRYDRAIAVLIVGMLLTAVACRPISCSQAAIRGGCRWRTGGCSSSPRPTS